MVEAGEITPYALVYKAGDTEGYAPRLMVKEIAPRANPPQVQPASSASQASGLVPRDISRFYVKRNECIFGPYSVEEVRTYLANGRLSESDLAQVEGTGSWVPLARVLSHRPAPPPPLVSQTVSPAAGSQEQATAATVAGGIASHHQTPSAEVRLGPVLRDVAIVYVLTAIGGFVVGLAGHRGDPAYIFSIAVSNLLLGTVGFTISGFLATGDRWRHLGYVALGAWGASFVNVLFFGVTVGYWGVGAFVIALMMGAGGGLSFLFKRS